MKKVIITITAVIINLNAYGMTCEDQLKQLKSDLDVAISQSNKDLLDEVKKSYQLMVENGCPSDVVFESKFDKKLEINAAAQKRQSTWTIGNYLLAAATAVLGIAAYYKLKPAKVAESEPVRAPSHGYNLRPRNAGVSYKG